MPQIAVAKTFLDSFARLPKQQQRSVRSFLDKFQENPDSPGINFERLNATRDDKVRSVRVDKAYRAIVIHPPKGDVYLCVWVDKHDDAYEWVRNKRFDVNPRSGVLQVYDVQSDSPGPVAPALAMPAPTRPARPPTAEPQPLFAAHDDEELLLAGIPESLLDSVRHIRSDDELDQVAPRFPKDAAEMLYLLAAGYSLTEAMAEAGREHGATKVVDPEDFEAALARPESQQQFAVVAGEAELEAILDAPLEQWRIFLHPSQRKLVRMQANGPVRVLGGAGTGKTIVLMHRANYLLRDVFNGADDRLLVTTFTRNLAQNLLGNLQNLCSDHASRLDVLNLHAWALQFLKSQKHSINVISDARREKLFEQAHAQAAEESVLPLAFYLEEWDRVVQPQDIDTRDAYFTARRVGRGTRLSRQQRSQVWTVFERYRQLMQKERLAEWADVVREARFLFEKKKLLSPYRAVLADEVQDFTAGDLRLLRAIAPQGSNTLFVVGDGHQRIYGQPERLGACGIDIRGRSRRLRLNYRTTEQIGRHAMAILEDLDIDDLDGALDDLRGYSSLRSGPEPIVQRFAREADESQFIVTTVKRWLQEGIPPEAICLAARTNSQINDRYLPLFEAAAVACVRIQRDPQQESARPGVRLATMHRLKGLEYSHMILAGVQAGKMPLTQGEFADHASFEDRERQERCLLYVACTRARDELVICGYGDPSPFLSRRLPKG